MSVPLYVLSFQIRADAAVRVEKPQSVADCLRAKDRIVQDHWSFAKDGRVLTWRSGAGAWLEIRPASEPAGAAPG